MYHAARALCRKIGRSGIAEVVYSGPLTAAAFNALAPLALDETKEALALMIRVDGCLVLMDGPIDLPDKVHDKIGPPGCLIVRQDQRDFWCGYAATLSRRGVRRIVFLDSQLELARQWVDRQISLRTLPRL